MFHIPPPVSTGTVTHILAELYRQGILTEVPVAIPANSRRNMYYNRDPRERD